MDTPIMAIKSKPLSISEMLNVINRGDGVLNVLASQLLQNKEFL